MQRRCGSCTLCCKLLPVRELNKGAGERCKFQRHTGCAIYARKPPACGLWSCMWLVGTDMGDVPRPDRAHYVIDPMPDYIVIRDNATGEGEKVPIIQIWMDPKFPDAHRDPALRAYLERRGAPALVRLDNESAAVVLFPPECSHDNQWHEVKSGLMSEHRQHTQEEIEAVMQAAQ